MGRKCIICKAVYKKSDPNNSFFQFPKNEDMRKKWLHACQLNNKNLSKNEFICSRHFMLDDFDCDTYWPRRVLLSTAVPFPHLPSDNSFSQQQLTLDNLPGPSTSKYFMEQNSRTAPSVILPGLSPSKCFVVEQNSRRAPSVDILPGSSTSQSFVVQENSRAAPTAVAEVLTDHPTNTFHDTEELSTDELQNLILPRYVGDLRIEHFQSQGAIKRNLEMINATIQQQNKKNKFLRKQRDRANQKITSFKNMLEHLYGINLITEDAFQNLMDGIPDIVKDVVSRNMKQVNAKYDPNIRAFALTLHFYSPKAYDYVRLQLNNLLPHPSTMRQWYSAINGNPGFTQEAFAALKAKVQDSKTPVIVNLVLDEISIREKMEFDGEKYHGMVDIGTGLECEELAKYSLVFMAVALNGHWKVPLGYFLLKGLGGVERAQLVITCLQLLHEAGAMCRSMTFDGAPTNLLMCRQLGA